MEFWAKLNGKGNYSLTVDGVYFGSLYLANDKVRGGSFCDPEVNDCFRRLSMNSDVRVAQRSVRDHLAMARRAYEVVARDWAAEAAADLATDLAVERFFENGGHAYAAIQADLDEERRREDMYGDATGPGQDWDANSGL